MAGRHQMPNLSNLTILTDKHTLQRYQCYTRSFLLHKHSPKQELVHVLDFLIYF